MVAKATAAAFNVLAPGYDAAYQDPVSRRENELIGSLVERLSYDFRPVLDIGCGTGGLISWAGLAPELYTGVDPSLGMLRQAKARFPGYTFIGGEAERLPVRGRFGLVVSLFEPLNYCQDLGVALREIERVTFLASNLFLMVATPRRGERVNPTGPAPGIRAYTRADLGSWPARLGCTVRGWRGPLTREHGPTGLELDWLSGGLQDPDEYDYLVVTRGGFHGG